jgi:hypothetical protein
MDYAQLTKHVDELSEDDALAIVTRLKCRFGWKGTFIVRSWAEQHWVEVTDPFSELSFSDFVWECIGKTKEFDRIDCETLQVQTTALYEGVARVRRFLNGEQ